MAQDTLLGFPAHTLPYRCGKFITLSTAFGGTEFSVPPFPWGQSCLLAQQTVQHRDHLGAGAGACGISRLSEPLRMAAFAAHAMASSAYADTC